MIRFLALVVALGAFLTACTDAPERLETAVDPSAEAPEPRVPTEEEESEDESAPLADDEEAGQAPSAESVTYQPPVSPRPTPRTTPGEVISAPVPPRPPMPAPPREEPEVRTPRNTAAADAFWRSFQQAVRSRDRAAIARGLADQVRVGDQTYAKSSEEVQAVLQAIVEEEAAREAYLAVDALTHGPAGSTFSTTAHYTIEGDPYEVEVFGTVREVSPGVWRLVEVGTR